jgi:hypothetical protein
LLERVEEGLHNSNQTPNRDSSPEGMNQFKDTPNVRKFTGEKQVIHISGWAKVSGLYLKYFSEFISKLIVATILLVILFSVEQDWQILFATITIISGLYFAKNAYFLFIYRKSDHKLRQIFFIDGGIQVFFLN